MNSEIEKLRAALEAIVKLQPKEPGCMGEDLDQWADGNIDEAFSLGYRAGNWEAAEIAIEALKK